jgi:hypothetical protein
VDELVDVERWSSRDELCYALEAPIWDRFGSFASQPPIAGTVTWTTADRRVVIGGRRGVGTRPQSGARAARLLLAALAARSDTTGEVDGLLTEELCRIAGLANSTYRRARIALLASGDVEVDGDTGGRGRTCRWTVNRSADVAAESVPRRRVAPRPGARPLVAAARAEVGGHAEKSPILSGVSGRKGPVLSGVSGPNPARNPATQRARGREPVNPRTGDPPTP